MNYHLVGFTRAKLSAHYFLQNQEGQLFRVDEFAGQRFMYAVNDFNFNFGENVLKEHDAVALEKAIKYPKNYVNPIPFNAFEILGIAEEGYIDEEDNITVKIKCFFLEIGGKLYRFELAENTIYEISFITVDSSGQNVTNQFSAEELQFIKLYCKVDRQKYIPQNQYKIHEWKSNKTRQIKRDTSREFRLVAYTNPSNFSGNVSYRFVRDQDDVMYRVDLHPNHKATLHIVEDENAPFYASYRNVMKELENSSLHAVIQQPLENVKYIKHYSRYKYSNLGKTPKFDELNYRLYGVVNSKPTPPKKSQTVENQGMSRLRPNVKKLKMDDLELFEALQKALNQQDN